MCKFKIGFVIVFYRYYFLDLVIDIFKVFLVNIFWFGSIKIFEVLEYNVDCKVLVLDNLIL